jgi:hypothetical protein
LLVLTSDEVCTIDHEEAITLAFMAASALFLSYRLRCQLYALLASFALDKQQTERYDQFAGHFYVLLSEYQRTIQMWVDSMPKKLDALIVARLARVSDDYRYDTRHEVCEVNGGGGIDCRIFGDDGYMYKDNHMPGA